MISLSMKCYHHVVGEYRAVFGDVLGQLGHAERFDTLEAGVPLPVHHGLRVLDVILIDLVNNFAHGIRTLS